MLPALEGIIRRRILLNFRANPAAIAPFIPAPLEVLTCDGLAIVGICLIGMERLRPRGLPAWAGLSSENMAHRVAIRYPTSEGLRDGVFIWRRDTDQCLVSLLGGTLFPGVHQHAAFEIDEREDSLSMNVKTEGGTADVSFSAEHQTEWNSDSVFSTFDDAANFFRRGDCGFSCSLREGRLDGMQLKTLRWQMSPLRIENLRAAFYQDRERFSPGSLQFDCALMMRGIPHEWHEIGEVPELAGALER